MPMINSTTARLVIVTLCIVVPQVFVWQLNHRVDLSAETAANFDVRDLPMQLGEWSGTAIDPDRRLFEAIGALSVVDRSYRNDSGRRVSVHLTSHPAENLRALLHLPAVCYSGQGWRIVKDDWQHDGNNRRFRLMIVEQSSGRAAVVYWYQLGPDVVSNREELRQIMQKLRRQGQGWPPVVKVMIHVVGDFSDEETKSPVEGLDSEIYKWVLTNS